MLPWHKSSCHDGVQTCWRISQPSMRANLNTEWMTSNHNRLYSLLWWADVWQTNWILHSFFLQWAVTFAECSAFSNVLTVSHKFRYCGHRFHLNDQACHTVLPLLLTSSHHNALLTPPSAPGSLEGEQPPTFPLPKGLPRYYIELGMEGKKMSKWRGW